MRKDKSELVWSLTGNKHSRLNRLFGYVFVFLPVLAILVLNGCAGVVSGTSTTGNPPPPSTLNITNVQAASTTTSTSQVVWATNVAANSSVDYGTSTSYGSSTPVDSAMVTSHQVTLSGLAAGTTYYYQVTSTDSNGNHGHSGGHGFKTSGFSLSGAINPAAGGSGATLTLTGAASSTTTADSSGNYTFAGLANGTYAVAPSHAGFTFTPSSQSTAVNGANVTGVNFTDTAQTFTISGTISPTAGGSGATVAVSGAASATTTANSLGVYTFTGLVGGSYTITPSSTGYTFAPVSQNVTLSTVNVTGVNFIGNAAAVAPTITAPPANQTVTAGQTASFTVVATGTAPLSYQWQKSGANIAGATAASYTTPATTASDSGSTFDVIVRNTAGTVTSAVVTLTVNSAPTTPTITTQPASQTVTAGQTATFAVVATGTAPLSYQWQKNGVSIAGATAASYTTVTTTADSGSTFRVVVSNTAGTVTSAAVTLTVNAAAVAPTITAQPVSQTVTAGQTTAFTAGATGTAPLGYQWQKNGVNIAGATAASYTTPLTTTADSGSTFRVVVSNTAGTVTSASATLTVNPAPLAPTITTQPANQTVTVGQAATFTVVATGTAPLSYQWYRNSAAISGATSSSYTTGATTSSDNGAQFTVVVSNTVGSVTSSGAALTVSAVPVAPSIVTQPASQTVTAGQTATFTVVATGTSPVSYQWSRNGATISGATSSSYTSGATTSSDNGAQFTVVISNTAGSVTSGAVTLTVNPASVAPTITTQPTSQTVTAGQTATFTVVATGTAPMSYQWQKNAVNIVGATSATYTTPATTTADSGTSFAVVVTNTAGTVTSAAATLTVNPAPVAPSITTPPGNQTVTAGQTATFTAVAAGTAPLSYQWQKNGVNIAGATSTGYTTPATTTTDSGSTFRVIVSNTAGTVTSSAATLTVNPVPVAPTITTQPGNQTVTAGQTASFTVVAGGTAPFSYQWQRNAVNIAGATSASYTTPATTTADSGASFDVVVSNTAGTVTSSAATLTVNPAPAPAIQPNPTSINFLNGTVGSSLSQPLIIKNTGTATLTITQVNETGSAFSVSGFTLPINVNAGQQTTITVGFLPTAVGTVPGNISIVSNAPTSPTPVGLSGTAIAATFTLGINPPSLSFGNVNVGSSSSQNATVTNTGNSNVTISGYTTAGAGFSASGVSANTILTPSQSATLSISFAPTAAGNVTGSVSVISNATNSPAVTTLSGSGVASTSTLPTCGKLNDTNVYVPPSYDNFTLPAKGQSYTDPIFGCKITRITDAIAMGWVSANHFYSLITPFNADDSYIYILNGFSGSPSMIVDLGGNMVVPSANMPSFNSAEGMVWDITNPKVFYYTNGNSFIKGTISGTPPNATVSSTTLHTFTTAVTIPDDVDLSSDGLHIWLADCYQNCTGSIWLETLNAGNGAATSSSQSAVVPNVNHHGMTIVPNNGVFVDGTLYNSNGTLCCSGTGMPDGSSTSSHVDWGLDSSGKIVSASIWAQGTTSNGCPSNFGWSLFDLATNAVGLCLNDGIQNVGNSSHVSMRDTQAKHWITHSVDDSGSCPSSSYWCYNNPTSTSGWGLYTGEIIIWDGTVNTVRLAHHRSRSDETYWAQTRAAISRDGRYIALDSNFNQSSKGANYTDVYVIGPLY